MPYVVTRCRCRKEEQFFCLPGAHQSEECGIEIPTTEQNLRPNSRSVVKPGCLFLQSSQETLPLQLGADLYEANADYH